MSKKYYGVIPPVVTPIGDEEKVDERALRKMIRHSIDVGMHGIFVAGSNGECMGLTQQERDKAISIAIDECGDQVPLLAGTMDTSTKRVIDNMKRLEQLGGRAAVVTPEFYARYAAPSETIRHFEQISKNTNLDIFIYNIPLYTHCNMKADTVFEIARFDHIVGYKDSGGSMAETIKCLHHFKGTDFSLMQGITQLAGVSMLLGADGFVPSIGPLFPKACLKVYEYGKNGDIENTMRWDKILADCQAVCAMGKNGTCATKYATSLLGITDPATTLPQEPLTEAEKGRIEKRTKELFAVLESTID